MTPEDGTDRLSQNLGKELPLLAAQDPEERNSHPHHGESLKSRNLQSN